MNIFFKIIFISLIVSCQSNSKKTNQKPDNQKLIIKYTGDADVVVFKMLEGLSQTLEKDSTSGIFEGTLKIPNLDEAIFSYDIVVHKKDTTGRMVKLEPDTDLIKLNQNDVVRKKETFLWIGKNHKGDYLENKDLKGTLTTKILASKFLNEAREVTVYTPEEVDLQLPHIYFTDGSVVSDYAPYIDRLISTKKIRPVMLIGIHSSPRNRYKEYVQGGYDNALFKNHESFVYNEVIPTTDKEIENWEGKRYLFGFSNGAAFCMHAGFNHPKVFEEIIAFSTADYISPMAQMVNPINFKSHKYPKFYMGAGRYETSIFNDNVQFLDNMNDHDIQVDFKEFISGHDYNVWKIEFLEYIETRFKK